MFADLQPYCLITTSLKNWVQAHYAFSLFLKLAILKSLAYCLFHASVTFHLVSLMFGQYDT